MIVLISIKISLMTMVSSYPVISSSLDYSPACLPPMEPVSSYPPTTRPTTSDLVELTTHLALLVHSYRLHSAIYSVCYPCGGEGGLIR